MQYVAVTTVFVIALLSPGIGYPQIRGETGSPAAHGDDSDMYFEPEKEESRMKGGDKRQAGHQTFYPSFSPLQDPPLGHSRPFYYQQEAAYSHRPQSGYNQQQVGYDSPRYSGYKEGDSYRSAANENSHGLLGSGNFGVIKGGTFYDNNNRESAGYESDRDFSPYFGNGHGRPSSFYYGGVPNPRPYQHEQFANFRDFADINAPANSAYSQFVVVYVNKNGTEKESVYSNKPKNIIESLALLDLETATASVKDANLKKLSKSKMKLASNPTEKKHFAKKIAKHSKELRDVHEPLLALS